MAAERFDTDACRRSNWPTPPTRYGPLARKGYITIPMFFLGWPTSELAPWLLGASALDAARRARLGAFRGKPGVTALTLTAVSWVLLALIHRRNLRSAPCFEEPLREALGADYTEALPLGRLTLAAGLLRSGSARLRYVGKANISRVRTAPRQPPRHLAPA